MSIIQLVLVILGIILAIAGVIDLLATAWLVGGVLLGVGVLLLLIARGGIGLTL